MEHLIDSCVWIDHLRPATPAAVRQIAHEAVLRPSAVICEPIWFEMLRLCPKPQRKGVEVRLSTLPMLSTPTELWRNATAFGQKCKDAGVQAGFSDLLIATVCQHHGARMVTFDSHFAALAKIVGFEIELLTRPV
jgi:predicted nucleic acid-binding protein